MTFWRMASPREERHRHGVRRTPRRAGSRALARKTAGKDAWEGAGAKRARGNGRGEARAGNRGGIARAGTPQAPAAPIEREGKRGRWRDLKSGGGSCNPAARLLHQPLPLPRLLLHASTASNRSSARPSIGANRGCLAGSSAPPHVALPLCILCFLRLQMCTSTTHLYSSAPQGFVAAIPRLTGPLPNSCMCVLPSPSSVLPPILPYSFLCCSSFPPPLPLLCFFVLMLCSSLLFVVLSRNR